MFNKASFKQGEDFSWQNALNCALASQLAYGEAAAVHGEAVGEWGFDECQFFDEGDTQGFVAWDSEIVLLSYRGTKQLGDWLVDMNILRSTRPYGKVHRGFLGAFEVARPRVEQFLQQANAAGKSVWVTGHSLGGAIATVLAAELLGNPPISGIYTYGQPRVVNRKAKELFRQHFDHKFFRVVNDDDVVAKVPALMKPVGSTIWFDADGELKESPPGVRADEFGPDGLSEEEFEEQQMVFRSLKRQINQAQEEQASIGVGEIEADREDSEELARGLFPSIRDHFMVNYIRKIVAKVFAE